MHARDLEYITRSIGAPMDYQEGPNRDGVVLVLASDAKSKMSWPRDSRYSNPEMVGIASAAIDLGKAAMLHTDESDTSVTFSRSSKIKVVVRGYDDLWIAVVVEAGHEVNKSLARTLRRVARRLCIKSVKSKISRRDGGSHVVADGRSSAVPIYEPDSKPLKNVSSDLIVPGLGDCVSSKLADET